MTVKTFNQFWAAEYEARRVLGLKGYKETQRIFHRYIEPVIGGKSMAKTTFATLDQLHQDLKDTPYQANRVLALLKTMYALAGAMDIVPNRYNPARDVRMFTERKRRRHMKHNEAPRIAEELAAREPDQPIACLYIWLMIFTGARSGEIMSARWCDLDGDVLTLRKHKTEKKTGVDRVIILPAAALEKLKQLGDKAHHPEDKIITLLQPRAIWPKIRVAARCAGLRIHDLRHTFGTYALEHGYTLDQIGEALNHSNPQTTKIYSELTNRSRRAISTHASLGILADMKVVQRDIDDEAIDPLS